MIDLYSLLCNQAEQIELSKTIGDAMKELKSMLKPEDYELPIIE